jgi:hypothetical protein
MPSTGTPSSNTAAGARGAFGAVTLSGPPESTMPRAPKPRTNSSPTSYGWISQYTFVSRSRRAISCVYCAPKSRIRMRQCDAADMAASTFARSVARARQPLCTRPPRYSTR